MNFCKTCNFWRQRSTTREEVIMVCGHPKLTEPGSCDRSATDELIYSYDECGYFETGPDFGCVHHATGMVRIYQGAKPENAEDKPEGDLVMEIPLTLWSHGNVPK